LTYKSQFKPSLKRRLKPVSYSICCKRLNQSLAVADAALAMV
jgi:hypothetical protein